MKSPLYNSAKIVELRKARGLTKAEVSRAIGAHWLTIHRAETGAGVSYELLTKLAAYHRVPVTLLLPQNIPDEKMLASA